MDQYKAKQGGSYQPRKGIIPGFKKFLFDHQHSARREQEELSSTPNHNPATQLSPDSPPAPPSLRFPVGRPTGQPFAQRLIQCTRSMSSHSLTEQGEDVPIPTCPQLEERVSDGSSGDSSDASRQFVLKHAEEKHVFTEKSLKMNLKALRPSVLAAIDNFSSFSQSRLHQLSRSLIQQACFHAKYVETVCVILGYIAKIEHKESREGSEAIPNQYFVDGVINYCKELLDSYLEDSKSIEGSSSDYWENFLLLMGRLTHHLRPSGSYISRLVNISLKCVEIMVEQAQGTNYRQMEFFLYLMEYCGQAFFEMEEICSPMIFNANVFAAGKNRCRELFLNPKTPTVLRTKALKVIEMECKQWDLEKDVQKQYD